MGARTWSTDKFLVRSLIAKWKKQGYEKLCCVRCIQTRVGLGSVAPTDDKLLIDYGA